MSQQLSAPHRSCGPTVRSAGSLTLASALVTALILVFFIRDAPEAHAAGTVLVNETFTGSVVSDSKFQPLGDACLTGMPTTPPNNTPPAGASTIGNCAAHGSGPVPTAGTTPGWLQLTDVAGSRTGGILYNQALPAASGLVVTFDQAQYGGNGADGISFFLSDGTYDLSAIGASGGSLGYAQRLNGSTWHQGVAHGFLGLALDAWGNYPRNNESRGTCCTNPGESAGYGSGGESNYRPNVSIRGPGRLNSDNKWLNGYCLWTSTATNGGSAAANWPFPALRGSNNNPENAVRTVRITVAPTNSSGFTIITVAIDFHDGSGFRSVLAYTTAVEVPSTYKFGFASSTGSNTDAHLIRNLKVETVNTLDQLSLTKSADDTQHYAQGDTVHYTFAVTNGGTAPLTNVAVTDPLIAGISCPSTALTPMGQSGSTMTCTGTHVVTATEAVNSSGKLHNTATVTATSSVTAATLTAASSFDVDLATPAPKISVTKAGVWADTITSRTVNGQASPTADVQGVANVGEPITYTFVVKNEGNVTLNNVGLDDALLGWTGHACVATSLAPGATTTCTGSYTLTAEDVRAGTKSNTVTAKGTPASPLTEVTSAPATSVVTLPRASLTLVKNMNNAAAGALGNSATAWSLGFEPHTTRWDAGMKEQYAAWGAGGFAALSVQPGQFHLKEIGRPVNGDLPVVNVTPPNMAVPTGASPPTAVPPGYSSSNWTCTAASNPGVPLTIGALESVVLSPGADVTCTITNTAIAGSATWSKTDDTGAATLLSGSQWSLTGPSYPTGVTVTDCVAASAVACTGTDKDPAAGRFQAAGLTWGNYTLVESQAPLGYQLNTTPHAFTVAGSNASAGVTLGSFTNVQVAPLVLPLTGGTPRDGLLIAGLATIFLALVLGLLHRRSTARRTPRAATPGETQ